MRQRLGDHTKNKTLATNCALANVDLYTCRSGEPPSSVCCMAVTQLGSSKVDFGMRKLAEGRRETRAPHGRCASSDLDTMRQWRPTKGDMYTRVAAFRAAPSVRRLSQERFDCIQRRAEDVRHALR